MRQTYLPNLGGAHHGPSESLAEAQDRAHRYREQVAPGVDWDLWLVSSQRLGVRYCTDDYSVTFQVPVAVWHAMAARAENLCPREE